LSPAWNQQVQRFQARERARQQREQREAIRQREAQEARFRDIDTYFQNLERTPAQFQVAMRNPATVQAYYEYQSRKVGKSISSDVKLMAVQEAFDDVKAQMSESELLLEAPVEEWFSTAENIPELLQKATEYGAERMASELLEQKFGELEKKLLAQVSAAALEARTKEREGADRPSRPSGDRVPEREGYTREDLASLNPFDEEGWNKAMADLGIT